MRTHRQGALNFVFHTRAKSLAGEREGKKNPYTTVLHYWVGQNPTNREELEEGGGESGEDSTQTEAACSGPGVRLDTPGS